MAKDYIVSSRVDSDWSWIVCLGAFFCNAITDGIVFSFGTYYTDLREEFGASHSQAAWTGSLMMGMQMFIGPFVSVLVNKYGCRIVTMLGSVIGTIGLVCGSVSNSMSLVIFFYGVVGGVGSGMVFLTSVMAVNLYFEKRRALANGIAMCGAGIGTFGLNALCSWLLLQMTWRGIYTALAGFFLQCVVCGALFRPLGLSNIESPESSCAVSSSSSSKEESDLIKKRLDTNSNALQHIKRFFKIGKICANENSSEGTTESNIADDQSLDFHTEKHHLPSVPPVILVNSLPRNTRLNLEDNKHLLPAERERSASFSKKKDANSETRINNNILDVPHPEAKYFACSSPDILNHCTLRHQHLIKKEDHNRSFQPLYRRDIFYSGSVTRLQSRLLSRHFSNASLTTSMQSDDTEDTTSSSWSLINALKFVIDFSLLKNKTFLAVVLSTTLWTGQAVVMTFLPALAMSHKISLESASLLLSMIGISNIIGRIICGWVTDHDGVSSVKLYSTSLIIAGIVSIVIPFCPDYVALATCSVIFGLCMAIYVSLRTIVLVDLLGIENLTKSFGILAMIQGIGFTIAPPIAGCFNDVSGNYITSFALAGICFMLAGIICLPLQPVYMQEEENKDFDDIVIPIGNNHLLVNEKISSV